VNSPLLQKKEKERILMPMMGYFKKRSNKLIGEGKRRGEGKIIIRQKGGRTP